MTVIKWLDIYVSVRTQDRQSRSPTINAHGYYLRSIGVVYCVAIDVYSFTMTVCMDGLNSLCIRTVNA